MENKQIKGVVMSKEKGKLLCFDLVLLIVVVMIDRITKRIAVIKL